LLNVDPCTPTSCINDGRLRSWSGVRSAWCSWLW
jgi:hypothetical protein